MELWIRSQDREILRLADMLDIYEIGDDEEKRFFIEESGVEMGCYKSKERVLEVLDEIQDKIENLIQLELDYKAHNFYSKCVYQMPKE